ncbi:MAG: radical SAM protein [Candidatus Altiarchaeota archaeon]
MIACRGNSMNILLINVPSRRGIAGFGVPWGLLYVGSIIERCGHQARIIDPYLDDIELREFDNGHFFDKIDKIIEDYKPSIIGYGGIATSYGRTKQLSLHIKSKYPKIVQIAGGALASVYELLLTKTKVDVVFHGEADVSLPIFLRRFEKKETIYDILGLSYPLDGRAVRNDPAEQIKDLDEIPFPAYQLIDVSRYLSPVKNRLEMYEDLLLSDSIISNARARVGSRTHYIEIPTSSGCTNRCLFCYRHVRGVRRHSVDYVTNHIKYIKEKYGVSGFYFYDELFNSDYGWVMELCDAIEKNNLDIFYVVPGARADKVDERMLIRLKETGCIEVDYGQESGSDTILREYRKGISSQQNRRITKLTLDLGMACCVQLVIGSPKETTETIYETIQFLKDVDAYKFSLNYLVPLPETPIWRYVEENKLVQDVEEYLDFVAEHGGAPLINLTKEPDKVWRHWGQIMREELKLYYHKKTKPKTYYIYALYVYLGNTIPDWIKTSIPKAIRRVARSILKMQ